MSARARSVAVLAIVVASALTAGPAAAASDAERLAGTTEYLAKSQLSGGDLYPPAALLIDGASTQAWGALGLAAGGINAAKQKVPGGTPLYDSLKDNLGLLNSTGDAALLLLVEPTVHDVRDDDGTKGYEVEPLVNAVLGGQVRIGPDSGGFAWQSPAWWRPTHAPRLWRRSRWKGCVTTRTCAWRPATRSSARSAGWATTGPPAPGRPSASRPPTPRPPPWPSRRSRPAG